MLSEYESKIEEISEMYGQANKLIIWYETYCKKGNLHFTYELKDAYNHLMDAIAADIKLKTEDNESEIKKLKDEIESELGASRGHLFRLIFDVSESYGLKVLKDVMRIFDRYPKALVSKVYPNFNDEIRPTFYEFLEELVRLKEEKSSSSDKTVTDKVFKWAKRVQEFSTNKLEKNDGYKWKVFWFVVAWVASAAASGLVGAIISHFI